MGCFFRPKRKALYIPRVSSELATNFSAIIDIFKVTSTKLRVTVDNRFHANKIVACGLFSPEYRVYIPNRDVEIEGVVTEASLFCENFLDADSFGVFKNRDMPKVKLLDFIQLRYRT